MRHEETLPDFFGVDQWLHTDYVRSFARCLARRNSADPHLHPQRHVGIASHRALGDMISLYMREQVCETKLRQRQPTIAEPKNGTIWPSSSELGGIPSKHMWFPVRATLSLVNLISHLAPTVLHAKTDRSHRARLPARRRPENAPRPDAHARELDRVQLERQGRARRGHSGSGGELPVHGDTSRGVRLGQREDGVRRRRCVVLGRRLTGRQGDVRRGVEAGEGCRWADVSVPCRTLWSRRVC